MSTIRVPAVALLLTLSACGGQGALDAASRSSSSVSSPYVRLRFAQSVTQNVPCEPSCTYPEVALSASGVIELSNTAFAKQVVVHYQTDAGWVDAPASYLGPGDGGDELWSFTTSVASTYPPYFGQGEVPLAIRYSVAGATVWDNNDGKDYVVAGWGNPEGSPAPSVALGQDNLKVTDFSLAPAQNTPLSFTGDVTLKNLAYDKQITIVFTTDGWQHTQTIPARYGYTYGNGLETWSFTQGLAGDSKTKVEFAVAYEANGVTSWDNNLGLNYIATVPQ